MNRNFGERAVERVVGWALGAERFGFRRSLNCFLFPVAVYLLYGLDVAKNHQQATHYRDDTPELHDRPFVGW